MRFFISIILTLFSTITYSQNNVCFDIQNNPNTSDPALNVFSKYVDVYGCSIYAESTVSDDKVLHAAAIWAELIDNDEDGNIDDPALLTILTNNEAMMPIFESDGNPAMSTFENNYSGNGVSAVLWQSEMDPTQPGHWGTDATIEEILHTINHVGHSNLYSEAFSIEPNSSLMSTAMDAARGGQFMSPPANYPDSAWYHYDDNTCDYGCMAIEYMYWSIVSNMGILNDPATCSGIANEWELCSPELFENGDSLMYNLITDSAYKIPQNAPDGNYCPQGLGLIEKDNDQFIIFPNPVQNEINIKTVQHNKTMTIELDNSTGQTIKTLTSSATTAKMNTANLAPGVYYLRVNNEFHRKIIIQP